MGLGSHSARNSHVAYVQMSMRPHSLYVSKETYAMLRAYHKLLEPIVGVAHTYGMDYGGKMSSLMAVDEIADRVLSDYLKQQPGVAELIELRKTTESEYDAKAVQLVSKFKENGQVIR